MRKRIAILIVGFFPCQAIAQNPDSDHILTRIRQLQSAGDKFYTEGLFPSQRSGGNEKNEKEDNNIFFTALITMTLQSVYPSLSVQGRRTADSIIMKARPNYAHYKNRNGDITFNFWQTSPDQPFPNNLKYASKSKYRLPDDLDVTSIIFLTSANAKGLDSVLKAKMILHTNLFEKKIHSTYKRYRNYKAYNTWFGKKMPLEFDICVMSNVLLWVFQSGMPLNEYDHQTIDLIKDMVRRRDHLKHPYFISPSYQRSPVILYHLSRMIAAAPKGLFDDMRPIIVEDIKSLAMNVNGMDRLILHTSLYRLNEQPSENMQPGKWESDSKDFVFFRANLLAPNRLWIKKIFGRSGRYNFDYRCEAYNNALLLEFAHLSKPR